MDPRATAVWLRKMPSLFEEVGKRVDGLAIHEDASAASSQGVGRPIDGDEWGAALGDEDLTPRPE